jgi:hypothetical protein
MAIRIVQVHVTDPRGDVVVRGEFRITAASQAIAEAIAADYHSASQFVRAKYCDGDRHAPSADRPHPPTTRRT